MNSYSMEQLARQRIDELAADARGGQLAGRTEAATPERSTLGARRLRRPRAWLEAIVVRSRRPVAGAR